MAILPTQLARVSNSLRNNVATQTLARTQQSLLEVQNQLATGKQISTPSDDPGAAAIIQQLRKTLEQRQAYSANLQQATDHLSEVDSTLGDLTDLLRQASSIASANVGSDVTPGERQAAATIVQALYNQVLSLGNKQYQGAYLFAGDRSTEAPFIEEAGGIRFAGSDRALANSYDQSTVLPFMVNGAELFGAVSARVQGGVDLAPALTGSTRVADLAGARNSGVNLGPIQLGNGSVAATVDLTGADRVDDILDRINAAGVGGIVASMNSAGGITLSGAAGDNITVREIGGGTTAGDLGILRPVGTGAGAPLAGASAKPRVTELTPLSALNGGAGFDAASGMVITNGQSRATVRFNAAITVGDAINAINGADLGVRAEINAAGTGVNIVNTTEGASMTIAENGGTTATNLGVRSFGPNTPLAELNAAKGVRTVAAADLRIVRSDASSFEVDIDGLNTVQDVINAINAASGGAGITASFATAGNAILLTDTAGGVASPKVLAVNFSEAARDLGLYGPAVGTLVTGADVNAVRADGIFSHLAALRNALQTGDAKTITEASEGLDDDVARITRVRGQTGARVQEFESRQSRIEDQNLATKSLLSNLEDVDYTAAISKFQTLQTTLQASLQSAGTMMRLSLMDFLG